MLKSLVTRIADPSITLLRTRFLGYLDEVELKDGEKQNADFLTSEGVLVKPYPDRLCYHMSSPVVDGLIRTELPRVLYPLTPPGPPPLRVNRSPDILETLKKAVASFDAGHIANAYRTSPKSSGSIVVENMKRCRVPRESVDDTELMRYWATGSFLLDGRSRASGTFLLNRIRNSASHTTMELTPSSSSCWRPAPIRIFTPPKRNASIRETAVRD